MLSIAFMRSGCSKYLDSTSMGLCMASALVLALRSLISSAVTSSSPYSSLKGGKFWCSTDEGVMTPPYPQQFLCPLAHWLIF
jgi:hypothetical protein